MKKLLLLSALAISLAGCNGVSNTPSSTTNTNAQTTVTPSTTNPEDLSKELNTIDDSQDLKSMDAPDLTE